LLATLAMAAGLGRPEIVRGAEYTMQTRARYDPRPDIGRIDVVVDIDFANTTPDPAGQFSLFEEVRLAVHDQAANLTAADDAGALVVEVAVEEELNVATVTLREPLRYQESAAFRVAYELPDGEGPQLRVRPSLIVFPAWGFGTAGEVTVVLPTGYEVSVDGDPLTAQPGDAGVMLSSGPIADPSRWLAVVTGARPPSYRTLTASVALEGGTVDLQVRAFTDDTVWGERTLAVLERALPLLEERMGVPYSRLAPLVVTESVATDASGFGEQDGDSGAGQIEVAFDQPAFTALHQVAHVWLGPGLVEDRWIAEGIASWAAAQVAPQLGVELPFDPAAAAAESAPAAYQLAAWPASATPAQQRYGYAASWVLAGEIAQAAGAESIGQVLGRVAAVVDALAGADETTTQGGLAAAPLTTRSLLDHLVTATGVDLSARFGELALVPADVALLPPRAEAHAAYRSLLDAAGDWGAPDPVRAALAAWEFPTAVERTDAARAWLDGRNTLASVLEEAGLVAPQRLRDAFREHGGAAEGWAELDAERGVADAYAATRARTAEQRSVIEGVGLLGGPDPAERLRLASGRFAEGDLRGATDAISEAQRLLDGAGAAGISRVLGAVVAAGLLAVLGTVLIRRRQVAGSVE
ncbi:MAG: hypothetical protein ACRDGJ_04155, partial [Candidatus Limnocylindria bacterium]